MPVSRRSSELAFIREVARQQRDEISEAIESDGTYMFCTSLLEILKSASELHDEDVKNIYKEVFRDLSKIVWQHQSEIPANIRPDILREIEALYKKRT